jgi:flavoprotein hydroxylase
MCSGIRDVVNLSWKLDLVLRGRATETVLDSYTEERRAQVQESILSSVQLGRVICVTDPVAAAERDATVLANRRGRGPSRPEPAKPLTGGLLHRSGEKLAPAAGEVMPQGRVDGPGGSGLFDEVVGRGFVLLLGEQAPARLEADQLSLLAELEAHVVRLLPQEGAAGDGERPAQGGGEAQQVEVTDLDGVYRSYLARHGASVLLVRPDYHVFGAAHGPQGTAALLAELRDQLGAAVPVGAMGAAGAAG